MATTEPTTPLPLDWPQWRTLWAAFRYEQNDWQTSTWRAKGVNFMADEILGVWRIGNRTVELSEVTFLGSRGIGITYVTGAGTEVPEDGVAHSFAELTAILDRDCR